MSKFGALRFRNDSQMFQKIKANISLIIPPSNMVAICLNFNARISVEIFINSKH